VANAYFQFKQFTIQQDRCAMKVSTDACLFGAYVARQINRRQLVADTVLDIGTGTGLLSLMVAQKTKGTMDAVELDKTAFQQASHNFEQSPWKERLNIFNTDVLSFYPGKTYDCIISNPPFFEGDLKSGNKNKDAAKHDTTLTLEQLLMVIGKHLSQNGFFAVLLPCQRIDFFIEIAISAHYFLQVQVLIRHTREHPVSRGILFFSRQKKKR